MRIQSKFKDYYDFVSHKYGEDPDIVYMRGPLRSGAGVQYVHFEVDWPRSGDFIDTLTHAQPRSRWSKGLPGLDHTYYLEWIVAGPHVVTYLVHAPEGVAPSYAVLEVGDEDHPHADFFRYKSRRYNPKPQWPTLPKGERLNDLIRAVGAPVFRVLGRRGWGSKIEVADRVPVLQDFCFPALFPPEQLWQDLYATMTNVLRHNPDKAPPVEVGEKYRIEAAGFDLKSSFRHPVNLKKIK